MLDSSGAQCLRHMHRTKQAEIAEAAEVAGVQGRGQAGAGAESLSGEGRLQVLVIIGRPGPACAQGKAGESTGQGPSWRWSCI